MAKKKQNNKQGLSKIVPVLILLIVIIAALVFIKDTTLLKSSQQTTPQTTNAIPTSWKTYTSTDGSFSFQYPSNWKKFNELGDEVYLNAPEKLSNFRLVVEVRSNPTNLSLQDFINSANIGSGYTTDNEASKQLNTAVVINRNPIGGEGSGQDTLISHKNNVIEVYCGECSNEFTDHVLSTFKLIK